MSIQTRAESSLHIKKSNNLEPSVELDLWSLEDLGYDGSFLFMKYVLGSYAKDHPDTTVTIYALEKMSANSGQPRWAVFFAIVGNHKNEVREAIRFGSISFKGVPDDILELMRKSSEPREGAEVWVRESDYIQVDPGMQTYHIEDGKVWMQHEPFMWHTDPEWASG